MSGGGGGREVSDEDFLREAEASESERRPPPAPSHTEAVSVEEFGRALVHSAGGRLSV